jgi:pimeloyl-ACP methyl ester carboxylesterase
MAFPTDLYIIDQPARSAPSGSPVPLVVLVHGSLDRAESFRRVIRRLDDVHVVAYDRSGYHRSRAHGVEDLSGHSEDLIAVIRAADPQTGRACVVGHSLGGDVVVAAALSEPELFDAIGIYEPPMPWLGFRRPRPGGEGGTPPVDPMPWPAIADDPAVEAERFFRRMVGDAAWERLSEAGRSERRLDGPALVADLRAIRGPIPFDVTALGIPTVFARGGHASAAHHRDSVAWLAEHVPSGTLYEIDGATHGAHLSHPDAFAEFVRVVLRRGQTARAENGTPSSAIADSEAASG